MTMTKKFIPIVKKKETCKVFLESILTLEQDLRKTIIHTEEGTYLLYAKIDDFTKYLDENFLRCHHSCVINLDKVVKMKDQTAYFENGYHTSFGRDTFRYVKQHFAGHMLRSANKSLQQREM